MPADSGSWILRKQVVTFETDRSETLQLQLLGEHTLFDLAKATLKHVVAHERDGDARVDGHT
eukprot:5958567-Pyramimonas_sp.AAC.1